jgi:hypothetical protein
MNTRVSLAELAAARIQLRPSEAVAIVDELCRRCEDGLARGIPTAGVVRLSRDGRLTIEGPIETGDEVARASQLINDLLPPFDATPEYRASGALRLAVARGLGTLDLPPYESLAELRAVLQRFAPADLVDTARSLFLAWDRARATHALDRRDAAALTISDVRRARRATGLTLQDLAETSEIPALQLRALEWGDLRSWHADAEGRAEVVRYARAAGLDETIVLSIAWPLIQESGLPAREKPRVEVLVLSGPQRVVRFETPHATRQHGRRAPVWVAIAAALIAALGVMAARIVERPILLTPPIASPAAAPVAAIQIGGASPLEPAVVIAAPEPRPAPAAARSAAKRRPAVAPAKRRAKPQHTSFFQKELFRIVFK